MACLTPSVTNGAYRTQEREERFMTNDQFTAKAQEVLRHAKEAAQDLKLNYIGTEHLLMGLIKTKGSVASRILTDNGVDEDRMMHMIRDLIVQDGMLMTMDADGFSPRAEKVLRKPPDRRPASRRKKSARSIFCSR